MSRVKNLLVERWLTPALSNPRTTLAALAVLVSVLLPDHTPAITAVATAVGLALSADGKGCDK